MSLVQRTYRTNSFLSEIFVPNLTTLTAKCRPPPPFNGQNLLVGQKSHYHGPLLHLVFISFADHHEIKEAEVFDMEYNLRGVETGLGILVR